jgi:hypothetical protein
MHGPRVVSVRHTPTYKEDGDVLVHLVADPCPRCRLSALGTRYAALESAGGAPPAPVEGGGGASGGAPPAGQDGEGGAAEAPEGAAEPLAVFISPHGLLGLVDMLYAAVRREYLHYLRTGTVGELGTTGPGLWRLEVYRVDAPAPDAAGLPPSGAEIRK